MDNRSAGARVSITRPNNTTTYGNGDVVGATAAAIRIPNMGVAGRITRLKSFGLLLPLSAVPAGMTSWTLHLYNATPPSALADNAAWDLPSGDLDAYLGSVASGANMADLGASLGVFNDALSKDVKLITTDLYAYLVTAAGYDPTAQAVYRLILNGEVL